jgi:hypothetical protein
VILFAVRAHNRCVCIRPKTALFVRILAIFALYTFTNVAIACEDVNAPDATSQITQDQHQDISEKHLTHDEHENCDSKCCEKGCKCKVGSCTIVWLLKSTEATLQVRLFNSYDTFQNYYNFALPAQRNRPPISS